MNIRKEIDLSIDYLERVIKKSESKNESTYLRKSWLNLLKSLNNKYFVKNNL